MKNAKENQKCLPEVMVLERLIGITRIVRKGNDPAMAEAAAKYEQRFARELEEAKQAA